MIDGSILVGSEFRRSARTFRGHDPSTGEVIGPAFAESSKIDIADACRLASAAAEGFAVLPPQSRAAFLERIGDAILGLGDVLIHTAMAETGLSRARLEGERLRTTEQLRMFASEVRAGEWLDVTIDPSLPNRVPPRPDLRRMNEALGPVAVFGASNFPLAFSVAGGDTAAALAAGCPVVAKGHPAHPGTGELVARSIRGAALASRLEEGVFSFLPGRSDAVGAALVADPAIAAVGFTGSRAAGLALIAIAHGREVPIPVFAEMSSTNPVVLMPCALRARGQSLAAAFVASLTLGAGQFCTNPGLVFAIEDPDLDRFIAAAASAISASAAQVMLTPAMHATYTKGLAARDAHGSLLRIAAGASAGGLQASATLHAIAAADFLRDKSLVEELFGAASLVVRCRDVNELTDAISLLEGQLTGTVHFEDSEKAAAARVFAALRPRVGRIVANGWPTGVEVSRAMVHGGPFPASSDVRTSSVGAMAMARFLRPVCFQDVPQDLLPLPLRDDNPWAVPQRRLVER